MPYTPHMRTSRAHTAGNLNWQTMPPYATFVVPYAFSPADSALVPDPISRQLFDGMMDTTVGNLAAGVFTPARAGLYRIAGQFGIYKQYAQGQTLEAFFQLEVIRQSVTTVVSICDAVDAVVVADTGELVIPLTAEATLRLELTDRVQARLGFTSGDQLYIINDYTRTFLDVSAYWS